MNELSYLDYLDTYTYDELPDEIRRHTGRDAYEAARAVVSGLGATTPAVLPAGLSVAYRDKFPAPAVAPPKQNWMRFVYVAAACLVGVLIGRISGNEGPQVVVTEVTPMYLTDTVYSVDTLLIDREVVRSRTEYVRDTIFLPAAPRDSSARSYVGNRYPAGVSMKGREDLLKLLTPAR